MPDGRAGVRGDMVPDFECDDATVWVVLVKDAAIERRTRVLPRRPICLD